MPAFVRSLIPEMALPALTSPTAALKSSSAVSFASAPAVAPPPGLAPPALPLAFTAAASSFPVALSENFVVVKVVA